MKAIACVNDNDGIGFRNRIPWKSKLDMRHFKELTMGNGRNAVVMGRRTFESLNCRPLPGRRNYVLTQNPSLLRTNGDVCIETDIDNILMLPSLFDEVFIIGGSQVYEIFAPYITEWYITRITNSQLCDAFLRVDLKNYEEVSCEQIIDANQKVSFYVFRKQMEEP